MTLEAKAETTHELANRLYTVYERNRRATEALAYNALVQSWAEFTRLARGGVSTIEAHGGLFGDQIDGGSV